jgi:hypothetical protein
MLFKSPIMTQASGSLGGITAARNRAGMYLRARAKPVDPGSAYQQAARADMQAASIGWYEDLDDDQRSEWAVYAANVPLIGRLGDPMYITGMQMYIRSRLAMAAYDVTLVEDGPSTFLLATFTPVTVAGAESTQQLALTFDNTDGWANDDDGYMLVSISRPVNDTVNYFKGPFRVSGTVEGDGTTPPTSPQAIDLPFPVSAGQRIFAQIRSVLADGRLSTTQIASGPVAA